MADKITVRLDAADEVSNSTRALLFGALCDLAWPVVVKYRSDLFHDARWINDEVRGETTFEYAVREWGTHIGERLPHLSGDATRYRVTVRKEHHWWVAEIEEVLMVR